MKKYERWHMYYEVKRLKTIGLKISQISKKLNTSRTTVYRYLEMTYEEVEQLNNQGRKKKLDRHKNYILSWLQKYPNLSSSQVMDWLKERRYEYGVCEATVGNYVRMLRKKITRHALCSQKGKLIKKSCHQRDKNKKIDAYMEEVIGLLGASDEAREFLTIIRKLRSRYIRDQLQLIKETVTDKPIEAILRSLEYCQKNKLFSATCFRDALYYFQRTENKVEKVLQDDINPLEEDTIIKLAERPEIRDLGIYQNIVDGGANNGTRPAVKDT